VVVARKGDNHLIFLCFLTGTRILSGEGLINGNVKRGTPPC
jgi:hypothetical protein